MPAETQAIRAIAKEAYLYGFPMVEAYKTLYAQAVEQGGPNYKAPFNHLGHTAKVFTPADTAIVTPNPRTGPAARKNSSPAASSVVTFESRIALHALAKPVFSDSGRSGPIKRPWVQNVW